ncbi:MAG: hypothetical protein JWO86_3226 [Myxococcaceae bacterium]|jgi:hypothetical protein|nr:hypothetical protein [Myxococcaceae bacterium]MEA2747882.1 hypothetical protein [Myxococcales bacterium]
MGRRLGDTQVRGREQGEDKDAGGAASVERDPLEIPVHKTLITMMGAALVVSGCGASFPVPTQKLADAESASRSARELGADKKTAAQLNLKLADDEIEQAKVQMKEGNNQRAEYILLRAKADAELALALSRETDAKVETVKAVDTSNAKQNETKNANGSK